MVFDPFALSMQWNQIPTIFCLAGFSVDALPAPIDLSSVLLHSDPCQVWIDPVATIQVQFSNPLFGVELPPIPAIIDRLHVQCLVWAYTEFGTFYYSLTQAMRII